MANQRVNLTGQNDAPGKLPETLDACDEMKKYILPIIFILFSSCDPIAVRELRSPIQDVKFLQKLSVTQSRDRIINTIRKIAEHNDLEIHISNSIDDGSPKLHVFYTKGNFMLKVFEDVKQNVFIVQLADFPSFTRSPISKDIEEEILNELPEMTANW